MIRFNLNGQAHALDVSPDTPLLWVIRDHLQLNGTKYGCGIAECGACTVHLNGAAVRSCQIPVSSADSGEVVTIEGLTGPEAKAVQAAWVANAVPQCGYCQSGQIMSATVLLRQTPRPTDEQISEFMRGNICRCGTYQRIRAAIHQASQALHEGA
ncbi:(2Fe-2S)-binding protein [Thiomonas sp. FB-Cd]|uniref:(2Fe-2S)-binding protein n=1 Tax=Thiomonas sp. FB-Cd TaxID=1158292 RepID=UPI0004DEF4E4